MAEQRSTHTEAQRCSHPATSCTRVSFIDRRAYWICRECGKRGETMAEVRRG